MIARPTPRNTAAATVVGLFLTPDGKLPGFAQRRLDDLIARKKTTGLSKVEQRELSEALDYIDAKTIQIVQHGLMAAHGKRGASRSVRGTSR